MYKQIIGSRTLQYSDIPRAAEFVNSCIKDDTTLLCVLNGGGNFFYDILANLDQPQAARLELGFVKVKSYINNKQSEQGISKLPLGKIKTRNIIIVDDILDTGHTLCDLVEYYMVRGYNILGIATVLSKPKGLNLLKAKYPDIPRFACRHISQDVYAVGYGMDDNGKYRGISYIYEKPKTSKKDE